MTLDPPEWRPVARTRTYQLVISAIEEQILSGSLRVGDALPPERDLAARLEVSRPAVREALREKGTPYAELGLGDHRAQHRVRALPGEDQQGELRDDDPEPLP